MSNWREYLDFGWQLAELRPGSKAPRLDGWQKKGAPFNPAAMGAGLVHEHSGTCALDVDDMQRAEKWLAERDVAIADLFNAPDRVQLIGNPLNHGKLLYRLAAPRRSKKVTEITEAGRRNIIDFRCAGNQDVLPPSIHPDTGAPYSWHYGDALLGHWSQLPELPSQLDAIWAALVTPLAQRPAGADMPAADVSIDDLVAWLDKQDPDCDRDSWVHVGMRVHTATNGQGFYIWDNWSRKGEKYADDGNARDMAAAWRSFKVGGGLGVGPILAEKVASVDEFPITPPDEFAPPDESQPADNSAFAQAGRLLQPRLIFLTAQSRFWGRPAVPTIKHLDEHLNGPLKREDVTDIFQRFMPVTMDSKGRSFQDTPLDFWRRKIANPIVARAVNFHPGEGSIFRDRDGQLYVNTYQPYEVEALRPKPHETEAWEFLWSQIKDEHYRRWLQQFYSFILRYPGVKVTAAPLLYGEPGTGKSTLMKRVPELLYGVRHVHLMSNDVLRSTFSDALTGTWFMVLDELKTDGGKQDRVELANKMKPWITEPELQIHPKGLPPYYVTNRLQMTATSNEDDAVHINSNDRRWAVCEVTGAPLTPQQKLDLYEGFLETDRAPGVVRWLMQKVDLTGFTRTTQAPDTPGRREMIRASLGAWESKLAELAYAGAPPFDRDAFWGNDVREALLGSNPPNLYRIGSVLKRAGIPTAVMHTAKGDVLVWQNYKLWRGYGGAAILHHMETGERPGAHVWGREIPVAIKRLVGDDTEDLNADLLGNVNA